MHNEIKGEELGVNENNEWVVGVDDETRREIVEQSGERRQEYLQEKEKLADLEGVREDMQYVSEVLDGKGVRINAGEMIEKIGIDSFLSGMDAVGKIVEENPGRSFGQEGHDGQRDLDESLADAFIETTQGKAMVDGVSADDLMRLMDFPEGAMVQNMTTPEEVHNRDMALGIGKVNAAPELQMLAMFFTAPEVQKVMREEVPRQEGEENGAYNARVMAEKKAVVGEILRDVEPKVREQATIVEEKEAAYREAGGKAIDIHLYNSEEFAKARAAMERYNELLAADKREVRHKHHKLSVAKREYGKAVEAFQEHVREHKAA